MKQWGSIAIFPFFKILGTGYTDCHVFSKFSMMNTIMILLQK